MTEIRSGTLVWLEASEQSGHKLCFNLCDYSHSLIAVKRAIQQCMLLDVASSPDSLALVLSGARMKIPGARLEYSYGHQTRLARESQGTRLVRRPRDYKW